MKENGVVLKEFDIVKSIKRISDTIDKDVIGSISMVMTDPLFLYLVIFYDGDEVIDYVLVDPEDIVLVRSV